MAESDQEVKITCGAPKGAARYHEHSSDKHCVHRCSDDAPLEGLCGVCIPAGNDKPTSTGDEFIDWKQANRSLVGWMDCQNSVFNSKGDANWCIENKSLIKEPLTTVKSSESPDPDTSESSIMNIIRKVSDIEVSVDYIDSSINELLLRMKLREDEKWLLNKHESLSGGISSAGSYRSNSSSSTDSSSTSSSSSSSSSTSTSDSSEASLSTLTPGEPKDL